MKHISVIGAGVAGLWCGFLAAKKGFKVSLHDQDNAFLKNSCSYKAGGMLAFNCEADSLNDPLVDLGSRSVGLWKEYFPQLLTQNGSLLIALGHDKDQLRYFERITKNYKKITQKDIQLLEPQLDSRFDNALYYAQEAHIEPRRATEQMLQACHQLGVSVKFNSYLINSEQQQNITIDTTGLWGRRKFINLRGVKGEMIIIRCMDLKFQRPIRLLHPHHPIYIIPRPDHYYMIGATTIESDAEDTTKQHITLKSAGELLTQAFHLHPSFAHAEIMEMNVGYRPAYPDNKPKIVHEGNNIYLNGLYRHGWTIAPALAQEVISLL